VIIRVVYSASSITNPTINKTMGKETNEQKKKYEKEMNNKQKNYNECMYFASSIANQIIKFKTNGKDKQTNKQKKTRKKKR
jgi:hypothetical protein